MSFSGDHHVYRLPTVEIGSIIHTVKKVISDAVDHDNLIAEGQIVVVVRRVADQKGAVVSLPHLSFTSPLNCLVACCLIDWPPAPNSPPTGIQSRL